VSKSKTLLKNTLILAVGKISTQLLAFLLLPLYTLHLSPNDYGLVDLITTYIALIVPVVTVQMEMAAFRFLVDSRESEAEKKRVISNIFWIVLPILAVCLALYMLLTIFVKLPYSGLILLNICVTIFSSLLLQFARGLGDNKKFAIASVLTGMATIVATLVFVVAMRQGVMGMLMATAIANATCALYLFAKLDVHRYIDFSLRDRKLQKDILKYSSPLVPNTVSLWVISVSDRTIISTMISVAANGIYAISNKYALIFNSIYSIFSMSWFESASVHINSKDRDKFFSQISNASIWLFGSMGLLIISYIPIAFKYMVNYRFNEAYMYIPILILAVFFNLIVSQYGAIYIAKKLTRQVMTTSIISAVVNISLTIILIKFIGIYAPAIATAIAYLVMAVYRHYDIKKYVAITYERGIFVKMAGLYGAVMVLYYYNHLVTNIISSVLVTLIAVRSNWSVIRVMKDKVLNIMSRRG
jgi:O-antigen/teichoic acid export membrane protein